MCRELARLILRVMIRTNVRTHMNVICGCRCRRVGNEMSDEKIFSRYNFHLSMFAENDIQIFELH